MVIVAVAPKAMSYTTIIINASTITNVQTILAVLVVTVSIHLAATDADVRMVTNTIINSVYAYRCVN